MHNDNIKQMKKPVSRLLSEKEIQLNLQRKALTLISPQ